MIQWFGHKNASTARGEEFHQVQEVLGQSGVLAIGESGAPDELLDKYGMRGKNIVDAVKRVLARK